MMLVQNEISELVDVDNLIREKWMKYFNNLEPEEHLSGSTIEGAMMARLFQVTSNVPTSATPISFIYHCMQPQSTPTPSPPPRGTTTETTITRPNANRPTSNLYFLILVLHLNIVHDSLFNCD